MEPPHIPKNGPSCVPPNFRTLSYLKSVSVRNIRLQDQHTLLHCYFSIHPEFDTEEESLKKCAYVSEVVYSTLNPQWRSLPKLAVGASLTKFILCVWDCSGPTHLLIMQSSIALVNLMYIDSEEDILFPNNTVIFTLQDGLYCTNEVRLALVSAKKIIPMPMYEWKEELLKKGSKPSFSVDSFESIYAKQEQVYTKAKKLNELNELLAKKIQERQAYFEHISEKNEIEDKVEELKNRNDVILISISNDKDRIEEISGELEPKIEKLKKSQNELALKKVILEKETQIQCQKMENFKQIVLVSKKSVLQLTSELEKIFPITKRAHRSVKGESEWMICGFVLPHSNFDGYEEEQTATALGLVCHVVSMLAKYLDIPLRYTLIPKCSRSVVINIQSVSKGHYPLYSRGVDSSRFQYAVFLLNKNVEQLLDSREQGLKQQRELRETLPNLKKLLTILDQERETLNKK